MSRLLMIMLLGFSAVARGEVVVELVPDPPGPYVGGETITVHVWLHSQVNFDAQFDFVQLDLRNTNSNLMLNAAFAFDYTSLNQPHGYEAGHVNEGEYEFGSPTPPVLFTFNGWAIACYPCPDVFFVIPAQSAFHLGSIEVWLPNAPGEYVMDVLNAGAAEETHGMRMVVYDSLKGPTQSWSANAGHIVGGSILLAISEPIPALSEWANTVMTCLLAIAATLILRRGRSPIEAARYA